MIVLAAPVFVSVLMLLASIDVLYAQPTILEIVAVDRLPSSAFPLGQCHGDCDSDVDVRTSLLPRCQ
jgi:hypothetical protein